MQCPPCSRQQRVPVPGPLQLAAQVARHPRMSKHQRRQTHVSVPLSLLSSFFLLVLLRNNEDQSLYLPTRTALILSAGSSGSSDLLYAHSVPLITEISYAIL